MSTRLLGGIAAGFALLFGGLYTAAAAGYRLNLTTCEPLGLYMTQPERGAVHVGEMAVLCPPDNRYVRAVARLGDLHTSQGSACVDHVTPFLKNIVATAGMTVTVKRSGVWIGSRHLANSRVLRKTPGGKAVQHMPFGTYTIKPGFVWEYAPGNDAFDSRYYGPVPTKNILATAKPVWVIAGSQYWLKKG